MVQLAIPLLVVEVWCFVYASFGILYGVLKYPSSMHMVAGFWEHEESWIWIAVIRLESEQEVSWIWIALDLNKPSFSI